MSSKLKFLVVIILVWIVLNFSPLVIFAPCGEFTSYVDGSSSQCVCNGKKVLIGVDQPSKGWERYMCVGVGYEISHSGYK